jgi:hypothetical protein
MSAMMTRWIDCRIHAHLPDSSWYLRLPGQAFAAAAALLVAAIKGKLSAWVGQIPG